MSFVHLLSWLLLAALQTCAVKTFGTGNAGQICFGTPVHLFSHQVSSSTNLGIMSHFWTTGSSEQSMAATGIELRFNYAFDGESVPSISFEPGKAAGQFFGAVNFSGVWTDGTQAATPGNLSLFAAGDKVGKNAVTQGWWHQTKMPFHTSVNITISVLPRPGSLPPTKQSCATYYAVVRGYETSAAGPALILPSGFAVPSSARLLQQITDLVVKPNAFVPLLEVPKGYEAVIYKVGFGIETSPPWGTQVDGKLQRGNNYVEGCWSLLRTYDEPLPGQVLGTGLEDFWDSGYGFSLIDPGVVPTPPSSDTDGEIRHCRKVEGRDSICSVTGTPFQHPSAGILHFSSDYADSKKGTERFSGYRFFDAEVVGMDNGGTLGWTNGCAAWNKPGTNKCGVPPTSNSQVQRAPCRTSPTHVTAYVWAYVWPRAEPSNFNV